MKKLFSPRKTISRYYQAYCRRENQALFKLVDSIAQALHARPIDYITIHTDFNAGFQKVGWRQKTVLSLGYPLWIALTDKERVALIAHELAHDVNGDSTRSRIIGTACE